MNGVDATERLINQFSRDNDLIPAFIATGIPKIDAIAGVTGIVATTFFEDVEKRGHEAQGLSDWHQLLKHWCSDKFREICEVHPELSREKANNMDEMIILNGIRRGVKHAMGQSYYFASRHNVPEGFAAMRRAFKEDLNDSNTRL